VHGYELHTMSTQAGDRHARRMDEASTERLAREIRGAAQRRTNRGLGAAWSGFVGHFRPDRLENARARW
jgi:hypothetical protein